MLRFRALLASNAWFLVALLGLGGLALAQSGVASRGLAALAELRAVLVEDTTRTHLDSYLGLLETELAIMQAEDAAQRDRIAQLEQELQELKDVLEATRIQVAQPDVAQAPLAPVSVGGTEAVTPPAEAEPVEPVSDDGLSLELEANPTEEAPLPEAASDLLPPQRPPELDPSQAEVNGEAASEVALPSQRPSEESTASETTPEASAFAAALELSQAALWGQALEAWTAFLSQHRASNRVAEAAFYRGEALYNMGQFEAALGSFADSYQRDSRGPKAVEALLFTGLSAKQSGDTARACLAFSGLLRVHADADPSLRAQAQAEMEALSCSA